MTTLKIGHGWCGMEHRHQEGPVKKSTLEGGTSDAGSISKGMGFSGDFFAISHSLDGNT